MTSKCCSKQNKRTHTTRSTWNIWSFDFVHVMIFLAFVRIRFELWQVQTSLVVLSIHFFLLPFLCAHWPKHLWPNKLTVIDDAVVTVCIIVRMSFRSINGWKSSQPCYWQWIRTANSQASDEKCVASKPIELVSSVNIEIHILLAGQTRWFYSFNCVQSSLDCFVTKRRPLRWRFPFFLFVIRCRRSWWSVRGNDKRDEEGERERE